MEHGRKSAAGLGYFAGVDGLRAVAVLSVLLFWMPVLGLLVGALAWWLNRHSVSWTRRLSQVMFIAAAVVHAALGLFIVVALLAGW